MTTGSPSDRGVPPDSRYGFVVRNMTWSLSRANSFESCPYRWFLRYVKELPEGDTFFASCGKFVHSLIDAHYKNGLAPGEMRQAYLAGFRENVSGRAPSQKVFETWFADGLRYVTNFTPLPFRPVDTEKEVWFSIRGLPMHGFIDYIGEDADGGLVVADHKSRTLKGRSGRAKKTKADAELDAYLRQLYLYAAAVKQEYGVFPKLLCFNCFRSGTLVREPFDGDAFDAASAWLSRRVDEIAAEEDFAPNVDWFRCNFLCGFQDGCEYYRLAAPGRTG